MGLDTSHDCWHGPYSSFMEWRVALHRAITGKPAVKEDLRNAWDYGEYDDQSIPINVLMNHSDCDGKIPAEVCGSLADALEEIAVKIPANPPDNLSHVQSTLTFIAGLRKAQRRRESVSFH